MSRQVMGCRGLEGAETQQRREALTELMLATTKNEET
jgi:hypothetical protein